MIRGSRKEIRVGFEQPTGVHLTRAKQPHFAVALREIDECCRDRLAAPAIADAPGEAYERRALCRLDRHRLDERLRVVDDLFHYRGDPRAVAECIRYQRVG